MLHPRDSAARHIGWMLAVVVAAVCGRHLVHTAALAEDQSVSIGDNFYEPASVTVEVGEIVTWTNEGQVLHTVTSSDGLFDSGYTVSPGTTFSYTFTSAGEFGYYCLIHGSIQSGTVRVEEPPATTSPPSPAPTAVPTAVPTAPPVTAQPTETPSPAPEMTATPTVTPTSEPKESASPVQRSRTPRETPSATPFAPPPHSEVNGDGWLVPVLVLVGMTVAIAGSAVALWRMRRRTGL